MSIIELRETLVKQISEIEDISFLNALKTIIETKSSEIEYELSAYQKNRIEKARLELKNKQTVSHEELQAEIDQWLNIK